MISAGAASSGLTVRVVVTGAERFSARDDLAIALVDVSSYSCKLGILEAVEDAHNLRRSLRFLLLTPEVRSESQSHSLVANGEEYERGSTCLNTDRTQA